MRIAMHDGQIFIIELSQNQMTVIKAWNKMKWDRSSQQLVGPADAELLNHLASVWRLPEPVEAERLRLNDIEGAVDRERMDPDPEPLYPYPVKQKMYKHQIRGANMALMTFGLVPPKEVTKDEDGTEASEDLRDL